MDVVKNKIERDLRADFFRGWVLIAIIVAHFEMISGTTLIWPLVGKTFGYADGAQALVFISGYFFGIRSLRTHEQRGASALFARSLFRAGQLYSLNMFILSLVLAIMYLATHQGTTILPAQGNNAVTGVSQQIYEAAVLLRFPYFFDILPLFIILLAFAPILFIISVKNLEASIAVSFSLYAYTQIVYLFNRTDYLPFSQHFFSPTAYQFLFFIGMAIGLKSFRGGFNIPYPKKYLAPGIILVICFFVHDHILQPIRNNLGWGWDWFAMEFYNRAFLTPVHLMSFFIVAYVVLYFLPKSLVLWKSRPIRPLLLMGQNPLEVFCFGVVLTYLAGLVMRGSTGGVALLLSLEAAGVLLSMGFAYLLSWRQRL